MMCLVRLKACNICELHLPATRIFHHVHPPSPGALCLHAHHVIPSSGPDFTWAFLPVYVHETLIPARPISVGGFSQKGSRSPRCSSDRSLASPGRGRPAVFEASRSCHEGCRKRHDIAPVGMNAHGGV